MSVTIISFSLLTSPPKEKLAALVPKMYFHEEMQYPFFGVLATFTFSTHFSSTIRKNIKQPYETPGNVLIFIVFELQMKIEISNPLSSPVDEAYRCYIV